MKFKIFNDDPVCGSLRRVEIYGSDGEVVHIVMIYSRTEKMAIDYAQNIARNKVPVIDCYKYDEREFVPQFKNYGRRKE